MSDTPLQYEFDVIVPNQSIFTVPVDFDDTATKVAIYVNDVEVKFMSLSKGMFRLNEAVGTGDVVKIYLLPVTANIDKTISSIEQSEDTTQITIHYTTGDSDTFTLPVATPLSITSAILNENSELVITYSDNSTSTTTPLANTTAVQLNTLFFQGDLAVTQGYGEREYIGIPMTITKGYVSCKYNPQGADVVFTLSKNGTVFDTVTLPDGNNTVSFTLSSSVSLVEGDYIEALITSVGSTYEGGDLRIYLLGA